MPKFLSYSGSVITNYFPVFLIFFALACKKGNEAEPIAPAPQPFNLTIKTTVASNISETSAGSGGTIEVTGSGTIKMKGVCWSTSASPTTANNKTEDGEGKASFSSSLLSLTPSTTYYARAYAIDNKDIVYYGNEISFATNAPAVIISTLPITQITNTNAKFSGGITLSGTETIKVRGFTYNTSANPLVTNTKVEVAGSDGDYSVILPELTLIANQTYYVRAYAITATDKIVYGNEQSFTTTNVQNTAAEVTVATLSAKDVTTISASVGGSVTYGGLGSITAKGICYSKTSNPSVSDTKTNNGPGPGSFQASLANLTSNTKYFARAYAIDHTGKTWYGNQIEFTTPLNSTPVNKIKITTAAITSITATSAISGGDITIEGLATVSSRGVCWGTATNPTTSNSKTVNGSGTGSYQSNLTGLKAGTKYFVRSYAVDASGIVFYGNEQSFTTSPSSVPPTSPTQQPSPSNWTITTSNPVTASINNFGAMVPVSFKHNDNVEYVEFIGLIWDITPNVTMNSNSATAGKNYHNPNNLYSGSRDYNGLVKLEGAEQNTKYYVRAFVQTRKVGNPQFLGYRYGNEVLLTTKDDFVIESWPNIIRSGELNFSGYVWNSKNEKYTTLGFVWSTKNSVPTLSDNKITPAVIQSTVPVIQFGSPLATDVAGVKYYFRAYAITSLGRTVYGNVAEAISIGNPPSSNPPSSPPPNNPPGGSPGNPPPSTTPPSTGSRNSCIVITEKTPNTKCQNGSFLLGVKNTCNDKIDIKIALRKKNGTVDGGLNNGVEGNKTWSYWTCDGTGEYKIFTRTSGSTTKFPTDEELKGTGGWLR